MLASLLARSFALALVLSGSLLPVFLRPRGPAPRSSCAAEGRGAPPRHWLGCAGDPGPPRDLEPEERLVLGLPIDPNEAGERSLAFVPGLSRRLARAVVEHRVEHGPYESVDALLDVKGIGPKRLERARARLAVAAR